MNIRSTYFGSHALKKNLIIRVNVSLFSVRYVRIMDHVSLIMIFFAIKDYCCYLRGCHALEAIIMNVLY